MNTSTEIDSRIREVMSEILEVEPGVIRDGFGRDDAPGWDSLNHLRLVSALEEAFRIKFTMKEVGEMDRYETIRRMVSSRFQG
jgi:acyl carrier protein